MLLLLTGWISLFHKKLSYNKIRNITHWENPTHVVLRFWRLHLWRLGDGTAAFKDINIYMLGKFLTYIKTTDTGLAHCRQTNIYWVSESINLENPLNVFLFSFNLYNFRGWNDISFVLGYFLHIVRGSLWHYVWGHNPIFSQLASLQSEDTIFLQYAQNFI